MGNHRQAGGKRCFWHGNHICLCDHEGYHCDYSSDRLHYHCRACRLLVSQRYCQRCCCHRNGDYRDTSVHLRRSDSCCVHRENEEQLRVCLRQHCWGCNNPIMVYGYDLCIQLHKWCHHVVNSCCAPCGKSDLRSEGQVLREDHFPTSDIGRIWQHGHRIRHRTYRSQHCLQLHSSPRYSHCCYSNVYRRQQQCIHTLAIDALLVGCHLCGGSPVSSFQHTVVLEWHHRTGTPFPR